MIDGTAGEPDDGRPVPGDVTPAVYGSLLVTTLVAVQWRHDVSTTFLGLTLVASVAVFWLAHVWAETVNQRVRGPIDQGEFLRLARAESPMLAAAVVPTVVLGLGSIGLLQTDTAVGLALTVSMVQLFVWGWIVGPGRAREPLGRVRRCDARPAARDGDRHPRGRRPSLVISSSGPRR